MVARTRRRSGSPSCRRQMPTLNSRRCGPISINWGSRRPHGLHDYWRMHSTGGFAVMALRETKTKKIRRGQKPAGATSLRHNGSATGIRHHGAGVPLRSLTEQALDHYFASLNGHAPGHLYDLVLREVEEPLFRAVLDYSEGNQSRAADILGINRGTLRKKLKVYGIEG